MTAELPPTDLVELAFALAEEAGEAGEVPVGAMVYRPASAQSQAIILGSGRNRILGDRDPTAHAELLAIRAACETEKNERLENAVLITTLEPCIMCTGALLLARIEVIYFCARTESGIGALDLLELQPRRSKGVNHAIRIQQLDHFEPRARDLLQQFFRAKRQL